MPSTPDPIPRQLRDRLLPPAGPHFVLDERLPVLVEFNRPEEQSTPLSEAAHTQASAQAINSAITQSPTPNRSIEGGVGWVVGAVVGSIVGASSASVRKIDIQGIRFTVPRPARAADEQSASERSGPSQAR